MGEVKKEVLESRVEKALDFGISYGQIDGDHHKMWVIDQMLRALTGCNDQGESDLYLELTDGGEDYGPWDTGIAP